jgi:hypothetical protein
MRTILYSFTFLLALMASTQADARIWRLNNNGNGTLPLIAADFPSSTTLQQAHDNASVANGDTLHLEQSPTTYGNCTFTKRLVVIGAGYFLDKNPKTQVIQAYGSIVGQLVLQNPGCANSVITGLTQTGSGTWFIGANGVTITRNLFVYGNGPRIYIGSGSAANCDGIQVIQNYIEGNNANYCVLTAPSTTGNVSNLIFSGNIVGGTYGVALNANTSGIMKNNTFIVSYNPMSLYNFYVVNNLTYSQFNGYANTFYNSNVEYNIGNLAVHFVSPNLSATTMGSGNSTVAYGSWALVGGTSTDGQYQLTASSPAKATGKLGEDMGAFAGSYPYKLSGIASVPNIYGLTIAPFGAGATSISVTVSAKSNN